MKEKLFEGELVRLTAEDAETIGKVFSSWSRNSEYTRLLDSEHSVLRSAKKIKEYVEKDLEKENPNNYFFTLRTLEEDRLIGFVNLMDIHWSHGDCWVGIGLGDSAYWGKGYGTDAMRVILRYAFRELNLHRVTLGVFAYNLRAIRSYEKAGFKLEGTEKALVMRDGSRADIFIMGVLRREWEEIHSIQQIEKGERK